MQSLRIVLDRLKARSIYVAVDKVPLFRREMRWCGKVYSVATASHDPERMQGLATMRWPETVGELNPFLQAVNLMRTGLPEFAVVKPLWDMLDEFLKNKRQTWRVAEKLKIDREAWTVH